MNRDIVVGSFLVGTGGFIARFRHCNKMRGEIYNEHSHKLKCDEHGFDRTHWLSFFSRSGQFTLVNRINPSLGYPLCFFFDQFFFSCCLIVLRSFSFLVLVIWFMVSNLWMLDDFSDLASILLRDLGILARILASCERVTRISTFQVWITMNLWVRWWNINHINVFIWSLEGG